MLNFISNGVEIGFLKGVEERHRIIDTYYNRYQDLVTIEPKQHSMDYVHAYRVIKKCSDSEHLKKDRCKISKAKNPSLPRNEASRLLYCEGRFLSS